MKKPATVSADLVGFLRRHSPNVTEADMKQLIVYAARRLEQACSILKSDRSEKPVWRAVQTIAVDPPWTSDSTNQFNDIADVDRDLRRRMTPWGYWQYRAYTSLSNYLTKPHSDETGADSGKDCVEELRVNLPTWYYDNPGTVAKQAQDLWNFENKLKAMLKEQHAEELKECKEKRTKLTDQLDLDRGKSGLVVFTDGKRLGDFTFSTARYSPDAFIFPISFILPGGTRSLKLQKRVEFFTALGEHFAEIRTKTAKAPGIIDFLPEDTFPLRADQTMLEIFPFYCNRRLRPQAQSIGSVEVTSGLERSESLPDVLRKVIIGNPLTETKPDFRIRNSFIKGSELWAYDALLPSKLIPVPRSIADEKGAMTVAIGVYCFLLFRETRDEVTIVTSDIARWWAEDRGKVDNDLLHALKRLKERKYITNFEKSPKGYRVQPPTWLSVLRRTPVIAASPGKVRTPDYAALAKQLPTAIPRILESHQLSAAKFAKRVGCTPAYVSKIMNKKTNVTDQSMSEMLYEFPDLDPAWKNPLTGLKKSLTAD